MINPGNVGENINSHEMFKEEKRMEKKKMKRKLSGLVLILVMLMFAIPVMASNGAEKKEIKTPAQTVEHSIKNQKDKISAVQINNLKNLNKQNNLECPAPMVGTSSDAYYLSEVLPMENDVITQGEKLYIKFLARDTYKYYFTKPIVSIFDANSEEVVYSNFDQNRVSVSGLDTYSGYISWDTNAATPGRYFVYIVNAPCNVNGVLANNWTTFDCPYIKTYITLKASVHEHEEVIDAAVSATCTQPGKTQGSHCSVCGEVIKAQEVIPATGHKYEVVIDKAATCSNNGSKHEECTLCHDKKAAISIPATGQHTYGSWNTVKVATVFANGEKVHRCTVCGKSETQSISKLEAKIKLSATKKTVRKNKSYTLKISKLAKGDSVKSVKSSKKSIATVKKAKTNQYKITGKKKGTATITVVLKSGKKATCKITVK